MFDYVLADYALPVEEAEKSMETPPNWKEIEFQTQSLGRDLYKYTIEEDGQLYREEVERELFLNEKKEVDIKETNNGVLRQSYTGELRFYALHMEEEKDFLVEFLALFWKGDLKEVKLEECKIEDSKARIEGQKKIQREAERVQRSREGVVGKFIKPVVRLITFLVRWTLGWFIKLTWKIERWTS